MRNSPFWFVILALMLLLDFYVFGALRFLAASAAPRTRQGLAIAYWTLSVLSLLFFILMPFINWDAAPRGLRPVLFALVIGLFFAKLIAGVVFLIDDIRRLLQWGAGKLFFRDTEGADLQEGGRISRSVFLTWLGAAAGGGLFGTLIYGFSNKYDYRVHPLRLKFPNLPAGFRGLRVVQLSDIHSGSLVDRDAVLRGVEKVLALKPDLILFTGDLVNDRAVEMEPLMDVFSRLRAPLGVYSILGNHDYGDYVQWESAAAKRANLESLKRVHGRLGWRLLLNEHVPLERGGDRIALLGVENWSARANFPKYGDLPAAVAGTEGYPFKILMSHDPSHWEAAVAPGQPTIDLMLAGHTHGMQFGVELPFFRWSPVQYVYEQWAGLYKRGRQHLYVNRGFGFIGYPGRVGILPEITLITLE